MIKGSFILSVIGELTRVDYVCNPPRSTAEQYDFYISQYGKCCTANSVTVNIEPLVNVILTRIFEQTNCKPETVGINVD